jgi:hypothetical protein
MVNEYVVYRWARNVVNGHPHESGHFLRAFADAFLRADHENVAIMLPPASRLFEKYPTWDVEEPIPKGGKHVAIGHE